MSRLSSPEDEQHEDMISLLEAASVASYRTTGNYAIDQAALNNVAHLIARNTSVFGRPRGRPREGGEHRLLTREETGQGRFVLGGARLEFDDGRPTLGNISIPRREWQALLQRVDDWMPQACQAPEPAAPVSRRSRLLQVRPGMMRRMVLLSLLAASFLQFYYIGVVLEISSMPTLVVFVPPPSSKSRPAG